MIQPKIMRDRERERETDSKREERERESGDCPVARACTCRAALHTIGFIIGVKKRKSKKDGTITRILQKLVASPTGQSVTECSF